MIADIDLESYTSICVRNLPIHVDEKFVKRYIRSRIDPLKCDVVSISISKAETEKKHAFIDVGSYEKVQQAIREINGSQVDGQRIFVSLAIDQYSPSPEKKVYLRKFRKDVNSQELYDFLCTLGTVVNIDISYDRTKKNQLYSACATYFTEEQAQEAIRFINKRRQHEDSIIAIADNRYNPGIDNTSDDNEDEGMRGSYRQKNSDAPTPRSRSMPRARSTPRAKSRRVSFANEMKFEELDDMEPMASGSPGGKQPPKSTSQRRVVKHEGKPNAPPSASEKKNEDETKRRTSAYAQKIYPSKKKGEVVANTATLPPPKQSASKQPMPPNQPISKQLNPPKEKDTKQLVLQSSSVAKGVVQKQTANYSPFDENKAESMAADGPGNFFKMLFGSTNSQQLLDKCTQQFHYCIEKVKTALKEGSEKIVRIATSILSAPKEVNSTTEKQGVEIQLALLESK